MGDIDGGRGSRLSEASSEIGMDIEDIVAGGKERKFGFLQSAFMNCETENAEVGW